MKQFFYFDLQKKIGIKYAYFHFLQVARSILVSDDGAFLFPEGGITHETRF